MSTTIRHPSTKERLHLVQGNEADDHTQPYPITGKPFEAEVASLRLPTLDADFVTFWPAPDPREVERMEADVRAHGQAKPLVIDPCGLVTDPDGELMLDVLRRLGRTRVSVLVQEPIEPIRVLAQKLQREHMSFVRIFALITASSVWRERYEPILEAAKVRQKAGGKVATVGRPRDIIAESLGFSTKGRELDEVRQARRLDPVTIDAIATGKLPPKMKLIRDINAAERANDVFPWKIITSDWVIPGRSYLKPLAKNADSKFKGGIPEELIANFIRWCVKPGELVADPFGGSGKTALIARRLECDFVLGDQNEKLVTQWKVGRADLAEHFCVHRVEDGPLPGTAGKAKLVLLDIPYFDIMHKVYGAQSSSGLPWLNEVTVSAVSGEPMVTDGFCTWLRKVARSAFAMAAVDGYAVTFAMNVNDRKSTRHRLLRREFEGAMEEAGFTLADIELGPGESQHVAELVVRMTSENAKHTTPHAEKAAKVAEGRPPYVIGQALYVQLWKKRPIKTVFGPGETFSPLNLPPTRRLFQAVIDKEGTVTLRFPTIGKDGSVTFEPYPAPDAPPPESKRPSD